MTVSNLCLRVVAGDDVADGSQRRRYHRRLVLAKQLDQPRHDVGIDHRLNLVVRAVSQIRQRPARVGQHLTLMNGQTRGKTTHFNKECRAIKSA